MSIELMLKDENRMPDLLKLVRELKAEGATRIALHPDGSIASVEFGPASPAYEDQHDPSDVEVTPKRRPTGQLVPRGDRVERD